jgi:outer membrane protein OmpA-like peptidoglycan-associated protein
MQRGPKVFDKPEDIQAEESISEDGFYDGLDFLFASHKAKTHHWSVAWSDLMMTMFILFAVLFAYHVSRQGVFPTKNLTYFQEDMSETKRIDGQRDASPVFSDRMSELFQTSQRTLNAEGLQDLASVELIKDRAVMIVLTSDVLFDSGQAELKPENMPSLRTVGNLIKDTPYVINVIGHTDDIPIRTDKYLSNWELATARACVTAKFLIDEMGIAPTQISAAGHAQYKPIQSNDSPEGRAANRRVEIIIAKENPYMMPDGFTPRTTSGIQANHSPG